jgi:hypothetical protein
MEVLRPFVLMLALVAGAEAGAHAQHHAGEPLGTVHFPVSCTPAAQAEGQAGPGIELMRQAVELEGSTPKHAVTLAPTIPAPELLGDLLMAQKKPAEALAAYGRSLELYPNRLNSLRGVAEARAAAR